jgi:deazaflavin-dependent oxidoreductase (nitroreductase family)
MPDHPSRTRAPLLLFATGRCSLIHVESTALRPEEDHRMTTTAARYLAPDAFTRRVFNPLVARLTKWGISLKGSRILEVRGRTSGETRSTVVNLLMVDGERYLVAPRGETQWVRNLRADGGRGVLRLGRRAETFAATELADDDKAPVLRAYLEAWAWEVGRFFDGLRADSPDADVAAAAPGFPVFRIS